MIADALESPMTPDTCNRPSSDGTGTCNGTIDQGYCDLCGMAALSPNLVTQAASNHMSNHTASYTTNRSTSSAFSRRSGSQQLGSRQFSSRQFSSRQFSSRLSQRTGSVPRSSHQLGAGLVSIPDLPSTEPETLLLSDPKVPEHRRFCGRCNAGLRREQGFCSQCGQKYSFVPALRSGDLVAAQYQVKGAIAYGGLGWIYLGFDQLLSRYVILKGLLNAEDEASAAVAVAERKFLAAVKHTNIVGVYNFASHGGEGFIVMEYVSGQTLKELRQQRGRLPVAEAIAYIHRILSAFAYLHSQGLVYCDFKPDNAMLEGGDLKLIDMGGVRRLDDPEGDIYGTVGYSAPEIAADGPSVASDLFTVGRTLAVLLIDIPKFSTVYQYTLPTPDQEPLFAEQESLYRFLLKATATQAEMRFQSADDMADQLLGVLREVAARETAQPCVATSSFFTSDPLTLIASPDFAPIVADYRQLPLPLIDATDPAFNALLGAIAIADVKQRVTNLEQIAQQYSNSSEARLQWANSLLEAGNYQQARWALAPLAANRKDWRIDWHYGRIELAQGAVEPAQRQFEQVYNQLPGELAPKLALALTAEQANQTARAMQLYGLVATTDPNYISASFGLARCRFAQGDRAGAVAALEQVPLESSLYTRSRVAAARLLTSVNNSVDSTTDISANFDANPGISVNALPQIADLQQATELVESLALEGIERYRLMQQIFETALGLLNAKTLAPNQDIRLLGKPLTETAIRLGLEQALRDQAHLTTGRAKIGLVDAANRVRPKTLI
jgi:serine/threonine-protein kinase PknG